MDVGKDKDAHIQAAFLKEQVESQSKKHLKEIQKLEQKYKDLEEKHQLQGEKLMQLQQKHQEPENIQYAQLVEKYKQLEHKHQKMEEKMHLVVAEMEEKL